MSGKDPVPAGAAFRARLALTALAVLAALLALYVGVIWNHTDYRLLFVPSTPLVWAFVGGSMRVLQGLVVDRGRGIPTARSSLVTWAVVRPVIGGVMGGFVYLALLSGLFVLNQNSTAAPAAPTASAPGPAANNDQPLRPQLVCVVAFIAGYSDRFSIDILNRIATGLGSNGDRDSDADEKA